MDTFNIDAELASADMHLNSHHLHDESCYRALTAKDNRFDGVFFVGVKTTGIYCRPICSAKTPRASSCTFYANAASAEAAGFRPCLRCRPELAPYALQQNLAYAVWQRITAGALNHGHSDDENGDDSEQSNEQGKVEKLAAQVGLSSRQLRRVLLAHFGVTPIELAQTQRLLFAKKLLQETTLSMTVLADAAGFGSVRRFNTLFNARYGMPPTALRRSLGKLGKNVVATSDIAQTIDDIPLRLAYRPPFSWDRMLAYLQPRLIAGVETVQPSYYRRGVRINGVTGWLTVTHLAKKNQLEIRIAASLASVLMPLIARLRCQFDLDANPAFIAQHLRQDAALAQMLDNYPGIRVPGTFDAFELAIRAILGQQVSVAGATTLAGRLVQRFGDGCVSPFAEITHHFPLAERLAGLSVEELATIGLPKTRAATIRAFAQFAADGHLEMSPGTTLESAVTQMKTVPGIGDWTAHYICLRALRFPDAFPAGDMGLQKAAAIISTATTSTTPSSTRLTEKQLAAMAHSWSPWRGYAALLLWHSL